MKAVSHHVAIARSKRSRLRLLERGDVQPRQRLVAPVAASPARARARASTSWPWLLLELAGVLDDDADAAGQLEVVDEEGDPHDSPAGSPGWLGGRPSFCSSSWM